ncbi:hypothetical protein AVEN_159599-1 [Araneus ventricosus]|uniref:Uncharacterized protein n=1 Tax=Araneus ventricosus TaxID=182803 RepID=A0A4Y2PM85_ARAVE|nr:hypothetical protein AVEN_159599-1 [Araneus ventricosus]
MHKSKQDFGIQESSVQALLVIFFYQKAHSTLALLWKFRTLKRLRIGVVTAKRTPIMEFAKIGSLSVHPGSVKKTHFFTNSGGSSSSNKGRQSFKLSGHSQCPQQDIHARL